MICYNLNGQNISNNVEVIYKGKAIKLEEALSIYVQFKSLSGKEKEAGDWVKELCVENGLFIKQMGDENGNYNFAASLYPLSSQLPNIIFLNHIDVVPSKDDSNWIYPPFSGKIYDGELWGRGAFDNKGNAVMQLFSLLEIKKNYDKIKLPFNVTFLAVSGEESQEAGGIRFVVNNYLEELNPEVIIGEGPPGFIDLMDLPSENPLFCISIAHKKALWIELELNIASLGHGSVTPLKYANKEMNNSLYKLLKQKPKIIFNELNIKFLKQLGGFYKGLKGSALRHPRLFKWAVTPELRKHPELFALFSNTVTLTTIKSDSQTINIIPSKITAQLDCRLLPTESNEDFLEKLKKDLDNSTIEIKVLQSMPEVVSSSTESIFFDSMRKAIKLQYPKSDVISSISPNFNDVGFFREKGIPAYTVIPVILEKKYLELIHNANERIPISILKKGRDTYVNFVEELLAQKEKK